MRRKSARQSLMVNMEHARSSEQRAVMEQSAHDGGCIFCNEHLRTYHKSPILKENRSWLVTTNAYPYDGSRAHLLLIHKRHIEHLSDMRDEEWADVGPLVRWVNKRYAIDGGSLFFRFGDTDFTGATISHLHGHIVTGAHRAVSHESIAPRLGYKLESIQ